MNDTPDAAPPESNRNTISVITKTLACLAVIAVGTVCVLAYQIKDIPPELNTLTAGLVGALTAMLVNTKPQSTPAASTLPMGTVTVPEQTLDTTKTES